MTETAALARPAALACALLALAGGAPSHAAEHRTSGSVTVYADTDEVVVVAPTMNGRVELAPVTLDAEVTVDIISAASVDLVSQASPRGYEEVRTAAKTGAELSLGPGSAIDASYGVSIEPDFIGHGIRAGHTRDLLDRRATLSLGYGFSRAWVGRAGDASFSRTRYEHQADLGWSHVLSKAAVIDLDTSLGLVDGFQASSYRLVRIYAPGAGTHATAVAESVPERRLRASAGARLRSRLADHLHGHAAYRFYADDWSLLAHTASAKGVLDFLDERLLITLEARGYVQSAASFYSPRYETFPDAPGLRTADKELGRMWTALGGIDVEWSPTVGFARALRAGVGLDVLHMRYVDHPFLSSRTAVIAAIDLTLEL